MSSTTAAGRLRLAALHDQLRVLLASVMDHWRIELRYDNPVGGGNRCTVADCCGPAIARAMCRRHRDQWRSVGRPDQATWLPRTPSEPTWLHLEDLPEPLRWEIAYGIHRGRELGGPAVSCLSLMATVRQLRALSIRSVLDIDESNWIGYRSRPNRVRAKTMRQGFLTFLIDELDLLTDRSGPEWEAAQDRWRLRRFGITGDCAGIMLRFDRIDQAWLRRAAKRFIRWRMNIGHSPSGIHRDTGMLIRLSRAATDVIGVEGTVKQFNRTVIERLLSLLVEDGLSANGRSIALSSLTSFFTQARQHDWLPGLPSSTGVWSEDFPRRTPLPARGISEFVMTQLESTANLHKLTDPRWRLLFPLLMQTGLRLNDALQLPLDCLARDHQDAPYLRYFNNKMDREALVPISEQLADDITTQAATVRAAHPDGCLFPRDTRNPRGDRPAPPVVASTALQRWLDDCGVHDPDGQPVRVTAHQFRHTLGTRLINQDVPQEVVRRILDHTSTEMTAHYARLHDTTVRQHWEKARKVNINGEPVTDDPDSPLGDATWMKQHLSRATMALPNGYCGLPLQQSCPHANACLTCPVFVTTPEFLDQHRDQLAQTHRIIQRAQHHGQLRLVEMNQRIATNLTNIINSLDPAADTDHDTPEA